VRHAGTVDRHRDEPDVPSQRGPDLRSDEVARVVQPPAAALGARLGPVRPDEGEHDVGRRRPGRSRRGRRDTLNTDPPALMTAAFDLVTPFLDRLVSRQRSVPQPL
jgi:hypothetical protein